MSYEGYLAHHGIKGMKWGIRRFQDKNGRLTAAGKKRAQKEHFEGFSLEKLKSMQFAGDRKAIEEFAKRKKTITASEREAYRKEMIYRGKNADFYKNATDAEIDDDIERKQKIKTAILVGAAAVGTVAAVGLVYKHATIKKAIAMQEALPNRAHDNEFDKQFKFTDDLGDQNGLKAAYARAKKVAKEDIDLVLDPNAALHRIVGYSDFDINKAKGPLYVAYKENDVRTYEAYLKNWSGTGDQYHMQFGVKKGEKIAAPTRAKTEKIFNDLIKNDPEFLSDLTDTIAEFDFGVKVDNNVRREFRYKDIQRQVLHMNQQELFTQTMWSVVREGKAQSKIVDAVRKAGFDALVDYHDIDDHLSEKPLILLNAMAQLQVDVDPKRVDYSQKVHDVNVLKGAAARGEIDDKRRSVLLLSGLPTIHDRSYSIYLAHHGIKGMKWGVRRFRNPDGSLTSTGERRQNAIAKKKTKWAKNEKSLNKHKSHFSDEEYETAKKAIDEKNAEKLAKKKDTWAKSSKTLYKHRDDFTTAEFRAAKERLELEDAVAAMRVRRYRRGFEYITVTAGGVRAVFDIKKKYDDNIGQYLADDTVKHSAVYGGYSNMSYDLYLAHHGIKGMKWGVRRFQNEDGSLTAAGKKRQERLEAREARKQARGFTKELNRNDAALARARYKSWNNDRIIDYNDERAERLESRGKYIKAEKIRAKNATYEELARSADSEITSLTKRQHQIAKTCSKMGFGMEVTSIDRSTRTFLKNLVRSMDDYDKNSTSVINGSLYRVSPNQTGRSNGKVANYDKTRIVEITYDPNWGTFSRNEYNFDSSERRNKKRRT